MQSRTESRRCLPRESNARLLSSTQRQSFLANLSFVSRVKQSNIALQPAMLNDGFIARFVQRGAKQDVVLEMFVNGLNTPVPAAYLDSLILDPGLLCRVSDTSTTRKIKPRRRSGRYEVHFAYRRKSFGITPTYNGLSASPRRAIKMDVFPEPVGPTIRLIFPFLNANRSLILSVNLRLEGVNDPSSSADQAKDASWNPMSASSAFSGV